MTLNKFNLPDVGEGLTEAEIVAWKVKAGDTVAVNDVLCEIETAKSLVELPSPFAGTVTELLVPEGSHGGCRHADHQRERRCRRPGACRRGTRPGACGTGAGCRPGTGFRRAHVRHASG